MQLDYSGCVQPDGANGEVMTLGCFPVLIKNLITFGFFAVGTVALIFIIISGLKLIRSNGDPKEAEGAQQTLTYAIIGLVIVLLAAAIVNFIAVITGANCIKVLDQTFGNCHQ